MPNLSWIRISNLYFHQTEERAGICPDMHVKKEPRNVIAGCPVWIAAAPRPHPSHLPTNLPSFTYAAQIKKDTTSPFHELVSEPIRFEPKEMGSACDQASKS